MGWSWDMVGPQEAGSLPLLPDCPPPLLRPQPHGRGKVFGLWASHGWCHCLSWSACFKNAFTTHVRLPFGSAVVRGGECVCSGINMAAPGLRGPPATGPFLLFMIGGPQATLRARTECRLLRRSSHLSGRGQWEGRMSRPVAGEEEGRGMQTEGRNTGSPEKPRVLGSRSWLV